MLICLKNILLIHLFYFLDVPCDLQFARGQRNSIQLIYNDYTYVKNAVTLNRTTWKCSRKVIIPMKF